ncbi:MAG: ribonuclease J [Candidatus Nomurabacteria bacterium]|jgi:ribonuclease J|nr:ribonuclease J [Candidatus Nomurabacteria bacterium]
MGTSSNSKKGEMKSNIEEEKRRMKLLRLREERLRQLKIKQTIEKNKKSTQKPQPSQPKNNNHSSGKAKIPATKNDANKVNLSVATRRGEMNHAIRMKFQDVNAQATQHIVGIPVNKSRYNGNNGEQISTGALRQMRRNFNAVRIIPMGGVGEFGIGKNMTLIEYKDEIVVIDMGVLFAGNDYPGVNYMIPDIKYLEQNMHKVKAVVFTHSHLDHIGACRHLLPKFGGLVPIYATEFTINMIKKQINELPDVPNLNYQIVNPFEHNIVKVSEHLSVELVHTLHSVPGNVSIIVRTPCGNIVYMGDWRFENNPLLPKFDMERLVEVAQKEKIHLLVNESTNIDSPGTHPHSEYDVGENMGKVMDNHANGRIIISCFSSQIIRMQLVLDEAKKRGRKVAFAGFSMINNMEVALKSRQIKVPKDVVMKMEDIIKLPDNKVTIICTGSQGELNAVLNRMITGAHRHIKIKATDTIVFSSNPIPGNEPHVVATVDGLLREGAQVIQHGKNHIHNLGPLHLSGHAYYEDHVRLVQTLKPLNYLPNHGEFYMLEHNAQMAEMVCGIDKRNILVCDDGDIVELFDDKIKKSGRVEVGSELYDNSGNKVHEAVVKDRIHISTEGIFAIILTISKKTGRLLKTPDIVSRAFIYLDTSEELIGKVRYYLRTKTDRSVQTDIELAALKQEIKDDVAHILYDSTGHTPVVIPVINKI